MLELCLTILGMGIVTYVPRMLPLVILNEIKLPPRWHNFFRFIPYAALGALIFPGILTATGSIPSALAGFTAALLLAFRRVNVVMVVFGGIAAVLMWQLLVG
ncbi:MAG TPA: AzlD domain-containing protein [Firmicutes bacterium]|jgi:branched-subunit amino acid transport protein|nr:AzlD domain-containing protein [Bacillota bacterium]